MNFLLEYLLISVVVLVPRNVQNADIHYPLEPLRESRKKSKDNAMNNIISYRLLLKLIGPILTTMRYMILTSSSFNLDATSSRRIQELAK
jgi:hypothetical protein